ncbi:putative reverse transcriptase zinc-binding domain-containing protein [Helianthus debilis subsp. tardiflorus]
MGSQDFSSRYVMDRCPWVPLKCNIFVWKAEMNRIPTVETLSRCGILNGEETCQLCSNGDDSVDHLFSSRIIASIVWQKLCAWCRVPIFFVFYFRDLLKINNHCGKKAGEKEAFQGIVIISCWSIWKARNERRFNGKQSKVESTVSEVRSLGFLWFKNRSKYKSVLWLDWCKFVIM